MAHRHTVSGKKSGPKRKRGSKHDHTLPGGGRLGATKDTPKHKHAVGSQPIRKAKRKKKV